MYGFDLIPLSRFALFVDLRLQGQGGYGTQTVTSQTKQNPNFSVTIFPPEIPCLGLLPPLHLIRLQSPLWFYLMVAEYDDCILAADCTSTLDILNLGIPWLFRSVY